MPVDELGGEKEDDSESELCEAMGRPTVRVPTKLTEVGQPRVGSLDRAPSPIGWLFFVPLAVPRLRFFATYPHRLPGQPPIGEDLVMLIVVM